MTWISERKCKGKKLEHCTRRKEGLYWIPEPKIYNQKLSYMTVKKYGYLIGLFYLSRVCGHCQTIKNIQYHHKNENKWDNRLANLKVLCAKCHINDEHVGTKKWKIKAQRLSRTRKQLCSSGKIRVWNKGLTAEDSRVARNLARALATRSSFQNVSKEEIKKLEKVW